MSDRFDQGGPVNGSHTISTGRVILRCPSCGAGEPAEDYVLAGSPFIVCRNCGETWPTAAGRARRGAADGAAEARAALPGPAPVLDAARRPLASYFDAAQSGAWAAKLEADEPKPRKIHRRPGSVIAAALSAAFLVAFVAAKEAAVQAAPDLAGLYAVLGLPVNLHGLEIHGVEAERRQTAAGSSVVVRGVIINVGGAARPVPGLTVGFRDAGDGIAGQREFSPPAPVVEVGAAAAFEFVLENPPERASELIVRFSGSEGGAGATQVASTAGK